MGDVDDFVEDITAEPEEMGYLASARLHLDSLFSAVHLFFTSNGWFILLGGIGLYYLWTTKISPWLARKQGLKPKSPEEEDALHRKEEQRLQAIQRLQQKYQEDAAVRYEKLQELKEKKDRERREELDRLERSLGGQKLGESSKSAKSGPSLRPEYNPLMGDSSTSGRVCYRRPGGGGAGG
jgi:hypothetical protein